MAAARWLDSSRLATPSSVALEAEGTGETPNRVALSGQQLLVGAIVADYLEETPGLPVSSGFRDQLGAPSSTSDAQEPGGSLSSLGLVAAVLRKLARDSEEASLRDLEGAVIAVPAAFTRAQRRAMMDGAALAAVPLLGLIDEPIAATYTYLDTHALAGERLLVVDLGASTLDLSLLDVRSGDSAKDHQIELIASASSEKLSGAWLDTRLIGALRRQVEDVLGAPLGDSHQPELEHLVETLKRLRAGGSTREPVFGVFGDRTVELVLDQQSFDEALAAWVQALANEIEEFLAATGQCPDELADVLFIGGYTAIAGVVNELAQRLGEIGGPSLGARLRAPSGSSNAIARGASIYAGTLESPPFEVPAEIHGRGTCSLGVAARKENGGAEYLPLIEQGTPLPARGRCHVYTSSAQQTDVAIELIRRSPRGHSSVDESIGVLRLDELPESSWSQEVELTLDYQADGSVELTADGGGGRKASLSLSAHDLDQAGTTEALDGDAAQAKRPALLEEKAVLDGLCLLS